MAVAYVGASNHLGLDLRGNPDLLKATLRGMENFTKRYHGHKNTYMICLPMDAL